jgi:hypothetical protein
MILPLRGLAHKKRAQEKSRPASVRMTGSLCSREGQDKLAAKPSADFNLGTFLLSVIGGVTWN